MDNILIIAPTATWKRDPAQIQLNDDVRDHTDSVTLKEKTIRVVPPIARKAPGNTTLKHYNNLQAIHTGNAHANDTAYQLFYDEEITEHKNGISFPDVGDTHNAQHLKGMGSLDY